MKNEEAFNAYEAYLHDLGILLKEEALYAKRKYDESRVGDKNDFDSGYLMGIYRVVSLMQQQAESFNIPLKKLGLEDINADRDLL